MLKQVFSNAKLINMGLQYDDYELVNTRGYKHIRVLNGSYYHLGVFDEENSFIGYIVPWSYTTLPLKRPLDKVRFQRIPASTMTGNAWGDKAMGVWYDGDITDMAYHFETFGLGTTPSHSVLGDTITVGTAAIQLPNLSCQEVLLQSDPSNTGTIQIGNSDGQWPVISAGASISIPVANANILWSIASTSGQVLHILARG